MYKKTADEALKALNSNAKTGLTDEQIAKSREKFGKNLLEENKKEPFILKFLRQFADVLIIILLIAAVISLIVDPSEWVDSLVIFIVVAINAVLGVVQESRAEKSLEALKKMSSPYCTVIRNGKTERVPSEELVVGDIIEIEAGGFIPADARLLDAINLQVVESALTGESLPVLKTSEVITGDLPTPVKYYNDDVTSSFKALEKTACEKIVNTLPPEIKGDFENAIFQQDGEEKAIVKCADKISAYIKCLIELKLGNKEFKKAKISIEKEITGYTRPEADYFMKNFVPAFEKTLDELDY